MAEFIKITAKDNPLIKLVCAIQSSAKSRKEYNLFALEGLRICMDAYDNSIAFDKLIITENAFEKHKKYIQMFAEKSANCYIVTESLFKKISDTNSPQGIIVLAKFPEKHSDFKSNGRYVALENISDPSNLGAVARTAEALGVDGIVLSSLGCDPYSPKSIRSSMGTLLRIPLYITDDIIGFAKEKRLRSIACVVDSRAETLGTIHFQNGDLIIIGNEANGLTEDTKKRADVSLTIPMLGNAESLNAAAAAAIVMWELVKSND